jgi:hypothetical protein
MNNYSVLDRDFREARILPPRPHPLPRPKPERLPRRRGVTIAIHLSGGGALLTATDTQETYEPEKVESGKIISFSRLKPLGAISIAGAGDSHYVKAISQKMSRMFDKFTGSLDELEFKIGETTLNFYNESVLPFVGRLQDHNVPTYHLLIAATHEGNERLWCVDRLAVTDEALFDCIGIGKPVADSLLNRLWPLYPTLDSLAILAAYVIYKAKSSVDGCGLKTEIRFMQNGRFGIGIVPAERIAAWEALFGKYERMEREIFYHAMNFVLRPAAPPPAMLESMKAQGHTYDHETTFPAQMRPMLEINKQIGEMQAEVRKFPVLKPLGE